MRMGPGGVGSTSGAPGAGPGATGANGMYQMMSPDERRAFRLRATYFRPEQYSSPADCLTAAHAQRLPLDLCR